MTDWFRSRPKLNIFLGILVAFIILLLVLAYKPFSLQETFVSDPAQSYEAALARISEIQAAEAGATRSQPRMRHHPDDP